MANLTECTREEADGAWNAWIRSRYPGSGLPDASTAELLERAQFLEAVAREAEETAHIRVLSSLPKAEVDSIRAALQALQAE